MLGLTVGDTSFVDEEVAASDSQQARKRHRVRHTKSRQGCLSCKSRRVKVSLHSWSALSYCRIYLYSYLLIYSDGLYSVMRLVLSVALALLVGSHAPFLTKLGFRADRSAPPGRDEKDHTRGLAMISVIRNPI